MAVNVGQRNVPDTPANRQLEACQKANASKGDSYKLIQRMDKYYNDLWREETDDN